MKTLIIYAHPETDGHCTETLRQVESQMKEKNKEYEIIDLYKIGYNPVLQKEELYTAGNRNISEQNLEFQQKIKNSNNLIFIYPVWWGTMPAILKGLFDRILTSGFAYKYHEGGKKEEFLRDKKAVVFVSSGGPRLGYLFFNIPKILIKNRILGFCGIKTKVYQIYNANKLNEEKINQIKKNVEKGIKFLN